MTSSVTQRYGIVLSDNGSAVGLPLEALVRPALRRNPRRAQLLVSTVLGKHIPVDPRVVAGVGRLLGALVANWLADDGSALPDGWAAAAAAALAGEDPSALLHRMDQQPVRPDSTVLTIGFAETATALGHLVADQLGSGYLHSTRRRSGDVPVAAEFSEPHSHATGHLLRPASPDLLAAAGTVVLVDDELSTGRTALNVVEVLHAIRPRQRYVLAGLVDVRSAAADAHRADTAERLGCRIDVVALVRGSVHVAADAAGRVAAELGAADPGAVADPRVAADPDVAGSGVARSGVADPVAPRVVSAEHVSSGTDAASTGTDAASTGADAASTWTEPRLPPGGAVDRSSFTSVTSVRWPAGVPVGGAHGYLPSDRAPFDAAVLTVADQLASAVGDAHRVLVLGTEEFLYLPLRVALILADNGERMVAFQSTTRSPVHAIDESGYPIRRRIDFRSFVDGGPHTEPRFLYNAGWPSGSPAEPDVVVIIDDGSQVPSPAGAAAAVAAVTGAPVLLFDIAPESGR